MIIMTLLRLPSACAAASPTRGPLPAWIAAKLGAGWLFGSLVLLSSVRLLGAEALSAPRHGGVAESPPWPLEPVYRSMPGEARQRFGTRREFEFGKLRWEGVAFFAVCTNEWPAGLVPIFAVDKTNRIELRRRAPRGQESFSEPLFFALPCDDEPDASKLAGHWDCQAVRGNASREFLAWELTIEGDQVSGRFDQNTQYRVAHIMGGTFRTNRIELRVEYMNDAYLLTGSWRDRKFAGEWRRTDDSERGSWEASRAEAPAVPAKDVAPLYEWRRASDDARRYALEGEPEEPGWNRSQRPLCRVWRLVRAFP